MTSKVGQRHSSYANITYVMNLSILISGRFSETEDSNVFVLLHASMSSLGVFFQV